MNIRSSLLAFLILAAGLAAGPARAAPVVGLSLLIDGSGSITAPNFAAQKTAYYNALSGLLAPDGTVAIEVIQFGSSSPTTAVLQQVFPLTTIGTAADKTSLLNAIGGMTQTMGFTPTGLAIQAATAHQIAFFAGLDPQRLVIDVSTDGVTNLGVDEIVAANQAIAAGIDQVNVLCIAGAGAECLFNRGVGSFVVPATFANIQSKLEEKLRVELAPVPEPQTYLLLVAGIALIGLAARRR
jgi:hypothetical protein